MRTLLAAVLAATLAACSTQPPGNPGGGSGGNSGGGTGGSGAAGGGAGGGSAGGGSGGGSATGGGTGGGTATGGGSGGGTATGGGSGGGTATGGGSGGGTATGGGSGGGSATGGGSGGGTATGGGSGGAGGGSVVMPTDGGFLPDGGFALRFIAIGDTGKGNQGQLDVANAIAAWCAGHPCDFVVLLGDNIYDTGVSGNSDPQWQTKFEVPYASVNLPFYAVLGNHDYGGGGTGNEFPPFSSINKGQREVDYSAISQKWRMPATHYQLNRAGVDLFGGNTNLSMFTSALLKADQAVRDDFNVWIPASTATWKIALGHHPYLSNGDHGNAGNYDGVPNLGSEVKKFLDDRVCGKTDLYLSGHDHSCQWFTSKCGVSAGNPGTELIVSGCGASTTTFKAAQPTHFQTLDLGFFYIDIQNRSLTGSFVYAADGGVAFSRTLTK